MLATLFLRMVGKASGMDKRAALDPRRSVVVEACAGSGKTWLLVSRIVRLLLDGAQPGQILAVTFTRKAAQEMQARLQQWLRDLAMKDEEFVRDFFSERGLDSLGDEQMQRARKLYEEVLLAQPGITISTFHGWFMQVIQRAPLNADVMQGMSLLERSASVRDEAWEELLEELRRQPDSSLAQAMQWLFREFGLHSTRKLLFGFLAKRAEWWAYADGQQDALAFALERLRADLGVDMDRDPAAEWGRSVHGEAMLLAFSRQLANNATEAQQRNAVQLEQAWTDARPAARFERVWPLLFTQQGEPRKLKGTRHQDAAAFAAVLAELQASLQNVRDLLVEQQVYRFNQAGLQCGIALLERYQALKQQKQQMDFSDMEWQLCRLLHNSDHAETMHYKLDSRYRNILLDEFQDTNPLQWQILRSWFDAAVAVESHPAVFIVGDPKQSIYRFRRADARLFGVAREYLKKHFAALELHNNHTRRNAPAVLAVVNAVFSDHPAGFVDFYPHTAEHADLPGYVAVLPLAAAEHAGVGDAQDGTLVLRDPLTTPRQEIGETSRHQEAACFAGMLQEIVGTWRVRAPDPGQAGKTLERAARFEDIMVLVRSRTHLLVYEEALRARHIPFISSRRGGLLDTLEAEDVQALLMFLITPFADIALAQVLRSPIFSCSDADLIRLSGCAPQDGGVERPAGDAESPMLHPEFSWWSRLQHIAIQGAASPALRRAADLLRGWLALADKLPVHDLLDRIYFEGDVPARYAAVVPQEMRAKVIANLHAFMEIALSVDAGRYPSLPHFLQELRELRGSEDEAPDEGRLGSVGNAVRIYTVHEAKGLEAPIVWLLDANAEPRPREGHDVLLDWPAHAQQPLHFSLYADMASRGRRRVPLFEHDAAQQAREEMNLLYVAMTRAQQALIVSGSAKRRAAEQAGAAVSWYDRIAGAAGADSGNPLLMGVSAVLADSRQDVPVAQHIGLPPIVPVGMRAARHTVQQQRGIWLHALLQHLAPPHGAGALGERAQAELQARCGIPADEMKLLWQQAQHLLGLPGLQRYFDPRQYRAACNEMAYVNDRGELKRIDRLVEFDGEVWVLDYKLAGVEDAARYRAQMLEYRGAMQAVYPGKPVRCALLFGDGAIQEVDELY